MMGSIRLLPLVAFAALCLFILKVSALFLNGGYIFTGSAPASAQATESAAKPAENASGQGAAKGPGQGAGKAGPDATKAKPGSAPESGKEMAGAAMAAISGIGPTIQASKSEFAVLQNLSRRRKDLDALEQGLQMRENLLKAMEKRVDARISELKTIEMRISSTLKAQVAMESDRFNRLVKMYSGMKATDAARIFDRLHIDVLIGLVQKMKPKAMSKILAAMNPAQAERITIEIAKRSKGPGISASSLPKIGR